MRNDNDPFIDHLHYHLRRFTGADLNKDILGIIVYGAMIVATALVLAQIKK